MKILDHQIQNQPRDEDRRLRREGMKGRSPLAKDPPLATPEITSVELGVPPKQPVRELPSTATLIGKSQEKPPSRVVKHHKNPPYWHVYCQPRRPLAIPQFPLSSSHRREQNSLESHYWRSLSSQESRCEAHNQSSKAEKCRKVTKFGPSIWLAQVVFAHTESSTELSSTPKTNPNRDFLLRKPVFAGKQPKRPSSEEHNSSKWPTSRSPFG